MMYRLIILITLLLARSVFSEEEVKDRTTRPIQRLTEHFETLNDTCHQKQDELSKKFEDMLSCFNPPNVKNAHATFVRYSEGTFVFRYACNADAFLVSAEKEVDAYCTSGEFSAINIECLDPHGSACYHDDDCGAQNSQCFDGVCKCIPGYRFLEQDNICILECAEYGYSMTSYDGLAISGYNERTLYNVATMDDCIEYCVTETSFRCLTVDFYPSYNNCYLQKVGFLDVDSSKRVTGDARYIHGNRDCSA